MSIQRLFLPAALRRRLSRLSEAERAAAVEQALAAGAEAPRTARVLDAHETPLAPCAMSRASELVRRGRATWVSQSPPMIRLLRRGKER
jgi:hypothetical protein